MNPLHDQSIPRLRRGYSDWSIKSVEQPALLLAILLRDVLPSDVVLYRLFADRTDAAIAALPSPEMSARIQFVEARNFLKDHRSGMRLQYLHSLVHRQFVGHAEFHVNMRIIIAECELPYAYPESNRGLFDCMPCHGAGVLPLEVALSLRRDEGHVLPVVPPFPFRARTRSFRHILIPKSPTSHAIYFGGRNFRARKIYRVHPAVERDNDTKE